MRNPMRKRLKWINVKQDIRNNQEVASYKGNEGTIP